MVLTDFDHLFWLVTNAGEALLCVLALRCRLWLRLPAFTAYVALLLAAELARWAAGFNWGETSRAFSLVYWGTQALLVAGRGAALVDVCRAALRPYLGVWLFARGIVALAAGLMLGLAALRSAGAHRIPMFVLFIERELEVAVLLSLSVLLALSWYYGVTFNRPLAGIAFGLALYSSVAIANYSILLFFGSLPWEAFAWVRRWSFLAVLALWCFALRRPLPAADRPALSTLESYDQNVRQVSARMRKLNARLLGLMKR